MAIHKSGQTAPKSGQYLEIGPKGVAKKELTIWKGEAFPLTGNPGSCFKLIELSKKNGSGK
jgi:YjzC-like protein